MATPRPAPKPKNCTAPKCTQHGGWVHKRPAKGEPKTWMAAGPRDENRRCWWHGPGAYARDPGKQSGEVFAGHQWGDVARLDRIDHRLTKAARAVPDVRAYLDDAITDALIGTGGRGSGVNDPTGGAALRIGTAAARHRDLSAALAGIERAVELFAQVAERCLAPLQRDPEQIDYTQVKPHTCPVMVMRTLTIEGRHHTHVGEHLERCGENSAHKTGTNGEPVDWDPDDYCPKHRAEADEATRRAIAEAHAERLAADAHRKRLARR